MDTSNEIFVFIGLILVLLAAAVQQMLPSPPVTCIGIDLGTTFSPSRSSRTARSS
jgi:hypothetical protein